MTKSVLLIITGLNMGGAEVQVYQLAKQLKMRGWVVNVISMIKPVNFVDELNDLGIIVHSLGMKPGFPSISALIQGIRLIKSISPDVVHSHMYHANIYSRILKLLFFGNLFLVSTAHNIDETEGSFIRYIFYRSTRNISNINTNVSKIALEHYISLKLIDLNNCIYIPNGIVIPEVCSDLSYLKSQFPVIGSKFVWLAAGRLTNAKDYPNLIAAVDILRYRISNFIVLIAGEGPLKSDIEADINNRGLDQFIKMIGLRRDLNLLMIGADAIVMSSAWEGLPMVLLEALSYGKTIVATDVGGISEIVGDFSGGELVPKSNFQLLAEAMYKVILEPQALKEKRSNLARFESKKFDIKSVVSQWENIYSKHN